MDWFGQYRNQVLQMAANEDGWLPKCAWRFLELEVGLIVGSKLNDKDNKEHVGCTNKAQKYLLHAYNVAKW